MDQEKIEEIRDAFEIANEEAEQSHRDAMNSYGAGYDRGYANGLNRALMILEGNDE